MVKSKSWVILNISLSLIAIILFLSLIGLKFPTLGNALYTLDNTEPICVVNYHNNYSLLPDIDRCCVELQQQLFKGENLNKIILIDGENVLVNKHYYTSQDTVNYLINMKTQRYCKNQGYLAS